MAEKIFVKLTEAEIAERSRLLAQRVCEYESIKFEAKERAAKFRSQLKELHEEIQDLATAIRSGHEERDAPELPGIRKVKAISE